jgi:hypothetical protein
MHGLGKIDKKKVVRNCQKSAESSKKIVKTRAFLAKMSKKLALFEN